MLNHECQPGTLCHDVIVAMRPAIAQGTFTREHAARVWSAVLEHPAHKSEGSVISSPSASAQQALAGVGLAFQTQEGSGSVVVTRLAAEGSASKCRQLSVGTFITAVDGESVAALEDAVIRSKILGPYGSLVTLTIQRDREEMDVVLERSLQTASLPGATRPSSVSEEKNLKGGTGEEERAELAMASLRKLKMYLAQQLNELQARHDSPPSHLQQMCTAIHGRAGNEFGGEGDDESERSSIDQALTISKRLDTILGRFGVGGSGTGGAGVQGGRKEDLEERGLEISTPVSPPVPFPDVGGHVKGRGVEEEQEGVGQACHSREERLRKAKAHLKPTGLALQVMSVKMVPYNTLHGAHGRQACMRAQFVAEKMPRLRRALSLATPCKQNPQGLWTVAKREPPRQTTFSLGGVKDADGVSVLDSSGSPLPAPSFSCTSYVGATEATADALE